MAMMSVYPWFLLSQAFQEMPRDPSFQGFRESERDSFGHHVYGLYLVSVFRLLVFSFRFLFPRLPLSVPQKQICRKRRERHAVILLALPYRGALISRIRYFTLLGRRTYGSLRLHISPEPHFATFNLSLSPTHLRSWLTCGLASVLLALQDMSISLPSVAKLHRNASSRR
jgi:hypothetical protein